MQSLHQRARLDAYRIDPPPAPLPDPDVVYDHLLSLAALAQALDPSLPPNIRFVRYASADEAERNQASFRVMFTSDTKLLSAGGYRDENAKEMWEALSGLIPDEMIQAEQQNLARSPQFRFASPADAAVYSAFKGGRLALETQPLDDDRVIQVSAAVTPPALGFMSSPTLARWVYLAPGTGSSDEQSLDLRAWRRDIQFMRQVLSMPFGESSAAERDGVVDILKRAKARRSGSFEQEHDHGWVGYAIATGGTGWSSYLLHAGADPHASFNGVSPICWAIAADDGTAVDVLTAAGVSASSILIGAPRVYQGAEQSQLASSLGSFPPLLVFAAGCGSSRALGALLHAGPDPDIRNERGSTALHLASSACDERTVRTLLVNGAKLDIEDENGCIPSQLIPHQIGDSLFNMMESLRIGECAPGLTQDEQPLEKKDAYGEDPSPWITQVPPSRRRMGL
jgi:hypothetical protein